jgi:hypothetical protein
MRDLSCSPEPVQGVAFLVEQLGQPQFLEQGGQKMQRYQSGKALQLRGNTKNQKQEEMVAGSGAKNQFLNKVAQVYEWLDEQIRLSDDLGLLRRLS